MHLKTQRVLYRFDAILDMGRGPWHTNAPAPHRLKHICQGPSIALLAERVLDCIDLVIGQELI
jgi:hypothetical protein